ncbi:hypothetical protein BJ980_000810 [Nocardioides daedukensis]|uniref:Uncharacterized protein n=1 Tax=Nocardioides daedukensis TaxID=634462 RepID=A0A7Y9RZX6_9ACTN|nr:hypothetical protein [Nocardioides daedukensis]NYG57887.1 hypothetical protein [Nocardioides daedukensis]
MSTRVLTRIATAATGAALGAVMLASPAQAQTTMAWDAADASGSNYDIRQVSLAHGRTSVGVNVRFADLKDSNRVNAGATIYFDVKASRSGPEYALTTGLGPGTDYYLVRVRDWKMYGDPKTCSHQVSLNFDDERLRVSAARSCFGSPAHVRVGVRMADNHDGSHPVSDWLIGWKRYTSWVVSN